MFASTMDDKVRAILEKQQYRFAGKQTAVKICRWTRTHQRNGVCYKQRFYGIQSHRCVQMSRASATARTVHILLAAY